MNEMIKIVIRVLPGGDEYDVEVPQESTGQEVIDEMISAQLAPRADERGNPFTYELFDKDLNREIRPGSSLKGLQVRSGHTLMLTPKLVAG
jgi:hypothetical protein